MKLLLTGSTGFLGSALQKKLKDHLVIRTSRSDEMVNLPWFFKKNISSNENFSDCLNDVDVIIHTAARVHQMNDLADDPHKEFMETNCFGTLNLAKQAAKAGVKRFIFISTIKVNGEQSHSGRPLSFDDPRRPEDSYGISKAKAEEGLLKIASETDLEVTIIRPPLVYGPNVKANFAALLNLAAKNIPLPLGSVHNKRSFVSVDNLVNLIVTCINHPKAGNKIFLVSDDDDVSTSKLFSIMVEAFGKKPRLINVSPSFLRLIAGLIGKTEMIDRLCGDLRVDICHTKNTLNWAPVVSLVDGIKTCTSNPLRNK
ncbi:SDR family oxidoreductase [Gammaproteobacteria bacterium]|nr:SDR family oxidoreductase [Gammaproteobacteria bacterium]|tara:strand:+ start:12372 stop:13310 length:939 start_codon:yes stop_codon:yes gene_type:complete